MPHRVKQVTLSGCGIGSKLKLKFHHYGLSGTDRAYIQASLHADELPGMLVAHHLIGLLEAADERREIVKEVVVVPYANPIGLNQIIMHSHAGRFSLASGVNFNRDWMDVSAGVIERVRGQLRTYPSSKNLQECLVNGIEITRGESSATGPVLALNSPDTAKSDSSDAPAAVHDEGAMEEIRAAAELHNVSVIRRAILTEIESRTDVRSLENVMKKELFKVACTADIVLDLHCDNDSLLHMYTHDRLWPQLADFASELGSECQILDSDSGGNCFDEVCSFPWAKLADTFPNCPIPMACQSSTVELRGQLDVSDELARKDAKAIYRFLQRRGYILPRGSVHISSSDCSCDMKMGLSHVDAAEEGDGADSVDSADSADEDRSYIGHDGNVSSHAVYMQTQNQKSNTQQVTATTTRTTTIAVPLSIATDGLALGSPGGTTPNPGNSRKRPITAATGADTREAVAGTAGKQTDALPVMDGECINRLTRSRSNNYNRQNNRSYRDLTAASRGGDGGGSGGGVCCPVTPGSLITTADTPLPPLRREPTTLTAVDMVHAEVAGVITWNVCVGEEVCEGQILGEIVPIEDAFGPRSLLIARTAGLVFGRTLHRLAVPGDIVIKVAGAEPLPWRKGLLLTSR